MIQNATNSTLRFFMISSSSTLSKAGLWTVRSFGQLGTDKFAKLCLSFFKTRDNKSSFLYEVYGPFGLSIFLPNDYQLIAKISRGFNFLGIEVPYFYPSSFRWSNTGIGN